MRVSDVNAFKGQFKDAALKWTGSLVDQMLPNKVAARTLVKNAIGNVLVRLDGKVNQMVDAAFTLLGMDILFKDLHPPKALQPIEVTSSGI